MAIVYGEFTMFFFLTNFLTSSATAVGGIPDGTTEEKLQHIFEQVGKVAKVAILNYPESEAPR